MDEQHQALLNAAAALARGTIAPPNSFAAPMANAVGNFDFLGGEWRISHRRLLGKDWDVFDGEATVWSILGGVGSVEDLRIPTRDFCGLGLRLFDVDAGVWTDFWVNARSGVLTLPGQRGSFAGGVGTFESDEMDGAAPIKVRGIWDRITPTSCRWRQAISRDGGGGWTENWFMDWVRA